MQDGPDMPRHDSFSHGLARAFAGALLFALPLLMTREMWRLGSTIAPVRLALLAVLAVPLLIALDRVSGFRRNETWFEDALDGLVGYGVGILAALAGLAVFGVLDPDGPIAAVAGRVVLEAVPAGYGAVLANSHFAALERDASHPEDPPASEAPYGRELFLMMAGALFFALQLAPTQEILLVASHVDTGRALVLLAASLVVIHTFVYRINFRGKHEPHAPGWQLFVRYSAAGFLLAAATSAYALWTYGTLDGQSLSSLLRTVVVLSFPASLGAAAARLLI